MAATAGMERPGRAVRWAGYLLGFALGGFFDGILLHQILQWHHLLSGLDAPALRDLRVQVLADGLFHGVMYLIAGVGLWLLWRARRDFAVHGADRRLFADALIGFGVWHVVDSVLSHWLLGLHRIRMDAGNPLVWDLIWFFAFGVAFVAAGWALHRTGGSNGTPGAGRRAVAPVLLAAAVLVAGPVAALPPPGGSPGSSMVAVLFAPGTPARDALAALSAVEGRAVWSNAEGDVWLVELAPGGSARPLYRRGALFVGGGSLPAGCFAWARAV